MFHNKNVLVAGGSGFMGTNLVKKLVSLGANVRATCHHENKQFRHDNVRYVRANLTNKENCWNVVRGMDYVFMCAANTSGAGVMASTPLAHVTPNVLMNTLMLDAAYLEGVKKFLFISTTTVYPPSDEPLKEEDATGELFENYFCVGKMKLFSEDLCRMYATKIKEPMPVVVVRPANCFGVHDDFEWETSHVLPAIMRRVIERQDPIEVWGDGNDIKDFLYIEDLVEGLILAMEKTDQFDIINIVSGRSHTIREALSIILEIEGYDVEVVYDASKPTMIPKRLMDGSKAKKLLGFEAKTSLRDGLEKTIKWYKEKRLNCL